MGARAYIATSGSQCGHYLWVAAIEFEDGTSIQVSGAAQMSRRQRDAKFPILEAAAMAARHVLAKTYPEVEFIEGAVAVELQEAADLFRDEQGPWTERKRRRRRARTRHPGRCRRGHADLLRVAERWGGWDCHWCGKPTNPDLHQSHVDRATIEHLIPKSKGGSNGLYNLRIACAPCNHQRGDDG